MTAADTAPELKMKAAAADMALDPQAPQPHATPEILQDIREDWLIQETSLHPEIRAHERRVRRLWKKMLSAMRRQDVKRGHGRFTAKLAVEILACLAVLIGIGVLIYRTSVESSADPAKTSAIRKARGVPRDRALVVLTPPQLACTVVWTRFQAAGVGQDVEIL